MIELLNETTVEFPWLLSNLKILDEQFMNFKRVKEYYIETINGLKVGFLGLMEKEWMMLCPIFNSIATEYEDFIDSSKRIVKILNDQNCDLIIALTHMRDFNN